MKKFFLLLLLIASITLNMQAQCPTSIVDQANDGEYYTINLANVADCALWVQGDYIFFTNSTGTGRYGITTCTTIGGVTSVEAIYAHLPSGTPIVLPGGGPLSFVVSGQTCRYGSNGVVLAVELLNFAANTEGGKNHLTWRTASEKDNSHFDIERSTDGNSFHNIGQVKGNNKPSSYQFVDAQPFATSYYRLRQMDNDGKETLSKVVSVSAKGINKLKVYPNPVSNVLTIETSATGAYDILNLLGQVVLNGKTPPLGVGGLDVSALPQGTYFLKIGEEQVKFVKQ